MSKKVELLSIKDLQAPDFRLAVTFMNGGYSDVGYRFQKLCEVPLSDRDSLYFASCSMLRHKIWDEQDKLRFMYSGLGVLTKENFDKFYGVYEELVRQFEKECIYAQVEACEAL